MRYTLITLSLLLASGGALAQLDAMKSPAPRPTDAARPSAVMPAKPMTPTGPLAASAARKPSVATGDNDDSPDLDVQRRTVRGAPAPGATGTGAAAAPTRPAPEPWCEDDCRAAKSRATGAATQVQPKVDPRSQGMAPAAPSAKPAAATTRSKPARGGGDGGPTGQSEDEVYIGTRAKSLPMKQ